MPDPYVILGVGRNASIREVRDAYRKLAMKFHPDRNSDPNAQARFQEINSAYEAIRDGLTSRAPVRPPSAPRPYYRTRRNSQVASEQEIVKAAAPYVRIWLMAFAVAGAVFMIDYFLPVRSRIETAIRVEGYPIPAMVMENGEQLIIRRADVVVLRKDPRVEVRTSLLFGFLRELQPVAGINLGNLGSIYGNFLFAPIIWLVLALAGILIQKPESIRFYLAVVQVVLSLIFIPLFVVSIW